MENMEAIMSEEGTRVRDLIQTLHSDSEENKRRFLDNGGWSLLLKWIQQANSSKNWALLHSILSFLKDLPITSIMKKLEVDHSSILSTLKATIKEGGGGRDTNQLCLNLVSHWKALIERSLTYQKKMEESVDDEELKKDLDPDCKIHMSFGDGVKIILRPTKDRVWWQMTKDGETTWVKMKEDYWLKLWEDNDNHETTPSPPPPPPSNEDTSASSSVDSISRTISSSQTSNEEPVASSNEEDDTLQKAIGRVKERLEKKKVIPKKCRILEDKNEVPLNLAQKKRRRVSRDKRRQEHTTPNPAPAPPPPVASTSQGAFFRTVTPSHSAALPFRLPPLTSGRTLWKLEKIHFTQKPTLADESKALEAKRLLMEKFSLYGKDKWLSITEDADSPTEPDPDWGYDPRRLCRPGIQRISTDDVAEGLRIFDFSGWTWPLPKFKEGPVRQLDFDRPTAQRPSPPPPAPPNPAVFSVAKNIGLVNSSFETPPPAVYVTPLPQKPKSVMPPPSSRPRRVGSSASPSSRPVVSILRSPPPTLNQLYRHGDLDYPSMTSPPLTPINVSVPPPPYNQPVPLFSPNQMNSPPPQMMQFTPTSGYYPSIPSPAPSPTQGTLQYLQACNNYYQNLQLNPSPSYHPQAPAPESPQNSPEEYGYFTAKYSSKN